MTTKLEYLKLCVRKLSPLESKTWYIMAMSIPMPAKEVHLNDMETLSLVMTQDGLHYVTETESVKSLSRIDDWKKGSPLFLPTDPVSIDNSWLSSVSGTITTTVGCLFVNAVALHPIFGARIKYVEGQISASKLETMISPQVKDDADFKPNTTDIKVSEYLACMNRLWFFTKLSSLVTSAVSLKMITPAPGTVSLRTKLLKENEGKLSDPVVVAKITEELDKHDKAYLSDDPIARKQMDGKANTSRKKLFLMYGETNDFVTSLSSQPITSTMSEGVDTSPDTLYKYMNDLRLASYSRGHSTQLSGYSYKILQRSLSGLEITDEPCNTTQGLVRDVTDPSKLVGRYVRLSNKWTLLNSTEEASVYKGKRLEVRSPMFCKTMGFNVCSSCMGSSFVGMKNAMNNVSADFSGELMSLFLKRMHTSGFKLATIDSKDLVT